jgi:hypothetical protein
MEKTLTKVGKSAEDGIDDLIGLFSKSTIGEKRNSPSRKNTVRGFTRHNTRRLSRRALTPREKERLRYTRPSVAREIRSARASPKTTVASAFRGRTAKIFRRAPVVKTVKGAPMNLEKRTRRKKTVAPRDEVSVKIPGNSLTAFAAIWDHPEYRDRLGELHSQGYKLKREGRPGGYVVLSKD